MRNESIKEKIIFAIVTGVMITVICESIPLFWGLTEDFFELMRNGRASVYYSRLSNGTTLGNSETSVRNFP